MARNVVKWNRVNWNIAKEMLAVNQYISTEYEKLNSEVEQREDVLDYVIFHLNGCIVA